MSLKLSLVARFGLVSLLLAAIPVSAQDADPGYPAAPVAAAEVPAIIAQAQVAPKATPAAPATPAKRVHDPLSRPEYRKGDSCTYVRTDWRTAEPAYTETVTFVTPRDVSITAAGRDASGRTWERQRHLTTDGNVVSELRGPHYNVVGYSSPKEYFRWPLTPGKTWSVDVTRPYIGSQGVRGTVREALQATFVGVETITVPAGAFLAVHVRLAGPLTVTIPHGMDFFNLQEDVWFSSQTGCLVRHALMVRHMMGEVQMNYAWVLGDYHRASRAEDQ